MTTRFIDFCKTYDAKKFLDTTMFGVMMVCEKYVPNEAHKPADVEPYVISKTPSAISWLQFRTKGMSAIIENHLQPKIVDYISKNQVAVTTSVKAVYTATAVSETIAVEEKPAEEVVKEIVKEVVDEKLGEVEKMELATEIKPAEIVLTRSEKVVQSLQNLTTENNTSQKFRDLSTNGIKYMVTYFVMNKVEMLGWAEEV